MNASCDARKALKSVFGRGSVSDPAGGGAHDAPPDPLGELLSIPHVYLGWLGRRLLPNSDLDVFRVSNSVPHPKPRSAPSYAFWIRPSTVKKSCYKGVVCSLLHAEK